MHGAATNSKENKIMRTIPLERGRGDVWDEGSGRGTFKFKAWIGKMTKGDAKLFSYSILKTHDLKNVNQQCGVRGHGRSHGNIKFFLLDVFDAMFMRLNIIHDVFVFLFLVTNNSKSLFYKITF